MVDESCFDRYVKCKRQYARVVTAIYALKVPSIKEPDVCIKQAATRVNVGWAGSICPRAANSRSAKTSGFSVREQLYNQKFDMRLFTFVH